MGGSKTMLKRQLDLNLSVPEPEFIGGIFPRKFFSVIASAPGVGKSWFVLRMLMELSAGGQIFNELSLNEPQRKVLCFCGENGFDMYIQRAKKLVGIPFNMMNTAIYSARETFMQEDNFMIDDTRGKRNIHEIMQLEKPDIVFFDTLISFHTSDESSMRDMTVIYDFLGKLAEYYNCAVVVIHHLRKRKSRDSTKISQDDLIGSSALTRLAALVISLIRIKNNTIMVRCLKSWYKYFQEFSFRLEDTEDEKIKFHTDFTTEFGLNLPERLKRLFHQIKSDPEKPNEITLSEASKILQCSLQALQYSFKKFCNDGILSVKETVGIQKIYIIN